MKIIDRISLHTTIKTILNFILAILKIFAPSKNNPSDKNIWKPRWRKNNE